jgi:hypothetical protein
MPEGCPTKRGFWGPGGAPPVSMGPGCRAAVRVPARAPRPLQSGNASFQDSEFPRFRRSAAAGLLGSFVMADAAFRRSAGSSACGGPGVQVSTRVPSVSAWQTAGGVWGLGSGAAWVLGCGGAGDQAERRQGEGRERALCHARNADRPGSYTVSYILSKIE